MSTMPSNDTPNTVAIEPHALTRETRPAEGAVIGYTGLAFWGEDFDTHSYVSGPIEVTAHTEGNAPGFYATTCGSMFSDEQHEIFVLLNDRGRQVLHGYHT